MVCGRLYGPASDAWALGVCLYEMASLRRPFEESMRAGHARTGANNQLALAKQIVEEGEEPLPQGCPEDLRSVISQLLKKDVEERLGLAEAGGQSRVQKSWAWVVEARQCKELSSQYCLKFAGHPLISAQLPFGQQVAQRWNFLVERAKAKHDVSEERS
eukprot:g23794.t1